MLRFASGEEKRSLLFVKVLLMFMIHITGSDDYHDYPFTEYIALKCPRIRAGEPAVYNFVR